MNWRGIAWFAAIQCGWFASVAGNVHGMSWLGPAFGGGILAVHLWFRAPGSRTREAWVLAAAAIFGFVVDTALLRTGVFRILGASYATTVSPAWLVVLWPTLATATAEGGSLASLRERSLALRAGVGAVAAPIAYDAGARLGAIDFLGHRAESLAVIGLVWLTTLPFVFALRSGRSAQP